MTIQYDNLNTTISAVGTATNIPINIQPKGTGGLNVLSSGQNLILQSQTFTNASWTKDGATATASGVTAPDSTSTGQTLTESATTAEHRMYQSITSVASTYTWSIYAKPNGRNWIRIANASATRCANFNISTGTVGTIASGTTATITDAGNGWYRCSMTAASIVSPDFMTINLADADAGTGSSYSYAGNGTSGAFFWGSQIELSSTLNTYVPTTTTAIYGTPTLTLSGVAGVGLQSDGSLYVQPAGVGAIQAQPTTSTAVGGNARGTNAVDWQTIRGTASQVASGAYSNIGGGFYNTATGFGATVAGGTAVTNSGGYSVIGGGFSNTVSGLVSGIFTGYGNTTAGYYNFVGGGQSNSGTSGSAVTTQSATMNGTTAVTLSGSNASIKVGQLVSGTSITAYPATYVSAVSGTSLTLSQVASGSTTNTISFFTPHGIVVGGGNNQATGSYSFIGGGGDAGTASNRNVASGLYSTVVGGRGNSATAVGAFVGGGGAFSDTLANLYPNTASGIASSILGGLTNTASSSYSSVLGGFGNTANGTGSTVLGIQATTRSISGNFSFSSCDGAVAFVQGVSQTSILTLGRQTTDATATVLTSNNSAAGTTNQVILPNNSAYYFRGEVISGVTGGGNTKGWYIEGVIKRGANAASTALVGTPTVTSNYADAGASTWTIAVTADTTNGGLAVTFTGQASTTIRTVCSIRSTEMTF